LQIAFDYKLIRFNFKFKSQATTLTLKYTIMKKIFILFCLTLGLLTAPCFFPESTQISVSANDKPVMSEMELEGSLATSHPRSLFKPIQAFLVDQTHIEIKFFATLGNLDILVYDALGNEVYRDNIDALAGNTNIVYLTGWSAGNYKVKIVNTVNACYAEGNFTITN